MNIMRRTWGPTPDYPNVIGYKRPDVGMIVIAGPCFVESEEQIETVAKELSSVGVTYMRGGVYRAGTYPPKDFGMKREILKMFHFFAHKNGLKNIVEVLDVRDLDMVEQYSDAFQVGARHMQDYALLSEISKTGRTVAIKRNMGATLDEFLGAAEYVCRGTSKPILIERGSSTHMNHVRWDLSISLIAAVKRMTDIPIIVDASHGTGRRDLVEPMTYAGIAAGADGFLVEVHPDPNNSLSDADQAYPLEKFSYLKDKIIKIRSVCS
jgi:3-deoxy-7-phosphoheptulonate synthase